MMMKSDAKGYDLKIFHQRFEAAELLKKREIIPKLYKHFQKYIDNSYHKVSDILKNLHD